MVRRSTFVAALGAALCFSLSAMAQTQAPRTRNVEQGQQTAKTNDAQFARKAAIGGMAEVQLGKLAMEKGSTQAVKQLGARLVRDHEKLNHQLKQVATQQGLQLPQQLDQHHQQMVDKFSQMQGNDFDRAFLKDQVKDHEKDIQEFQQEAQQGQDPALRQAAAQALPVLKEHLELAQSALNQIQGQPQR